jgi:hypothetical protein
MKPICHLLNIIVVLLSWSLGNHFWSIVHGLIGIIIIYNEDIIDWVCDRLGWE